MSMRRTVQRIVLRDYGGALLLVAAALFFSLVSTRIMGLRIVLPFFAAVVAAGWLLGRGPVVFATALSILAVEYFFARPIHSLSVARIDDAFFGWFVATTLIACLVGWLRTGASES
jgi:K+-sensing histidine kinase KdpD